MVASCRGHGLQDRISASMLRGPPAAQLRPVARKLLAGGLQDGTSASTLIGLPPRHPATAGVRKRLAGGSRDRTSPSTLSRRPPGARLRPRARWRLVGLAAPIFSFGIRSLRAAARRPASAAGQVAARRGSLD